MKKIKGYSFPLVKEFELSIPENSEILLANVQTDGTFTLWTVVDETEKHIIRTFRLYEASNVDFENIIGVNCTYISAIHTSTGNTKFLFEIFR